MDFSVKLVEKATRIGINLFDTSPAYGCGFGEEALSHFSMINLTIATKIPATKKDGSDIRLHKHTIFSM